MPDQGTGPSVDLAEVEAAVQHALDAGDASALRVLGYGEISLVIGWPAESPTVACKRLPPFPEAAAVERYRAHFDPYLRTLTERGVRPVDSRLDTVAGPRGCAGPTTVGYVVQPVLPGGSLGPEVLRAADPDPDHPLLRGVVAAVGAVVDDRTGLDGQISNWALVDGTLHYLDVTTPMRFGADGKALLDLDLFLAAYPWAMRAPIRRFVAPGVIGAYRDRRHVLVDMVANLLKERLDNWLPAALAAVNAPGGATGDAADRGADRPVTEAEVRRYYRSDARLWEAMLRLRRADRWWQQRVRRRRYPVLLPGRIER